MLWTALYGFKISSSKNNIQNSNTNNPFNIEAFHDYIFYRDIILWT